MHGGELTISSIEGEGTTVAFTLPINGPGEMEDAA
jgi:two-component system cell cycle sensor histidine kinase PleC